MPLYSDSILNSEATKLLDGIFSLFAVCTEVGGFVFVSYRSKSVGNVYAGGEIVS